MAENFDNFMNHVRSFKYIQNTDSIELGNGYSYVSKPTSPLLKEFTLSFSGYRFYFNEDGTMDYETNKNKNNAGALCSFYETMNMWDNFIYNDEQFGGVLVRFAEPLGELKQKAGSNYGVVEDFTVRLKEVAL